MLPGSKVITLVEKKRKEVAWLGLELTTSHLEVQCANHYTMETFMMNLYFFKCHDIKVITFEPGNIFELTWYSEWPLVMGVTNLMHTKIKTNVHIIVSKYFNSNKSVVD